MISPEIIDLLQSVRKQTELLCESLAIEDYVIQAIPDVSPPKWHLGHTNWFYETFIMKAFKPNYRIFDKNYHYIFNSYYQTFGTPYIRAKRGLLARPTVAEIKQYRAYVDEQLLILLDSVIGEDATKISSLLVLGLHHEMQHQELMLMDIKYNFSINPLFPAYRKDLKKISQSNNILDCQYIDVKGGVVMIGHDNQEKSFCYDNEVPQHKHYLEPFRIANRLVTNAEYLEFIQTGGYKEHTYWLSDGWDWLHKEQWQAPLYWHKIENAWYEMTLAGLQKLNLAQPVCHVSFYEADAFARWSGKRLLTEFEWEHFANSHSQAYDPQQGNFMEASFLQAIPSKSMQHNVVQQLYGDVWEWTASAYLPYPGYQRQFGALGEYNAKFMSNQMVLRGGSCLTPSKHMRTSYRNFFQPEKRWPMTGIRLAEIN